MMWNKDNYYLLCFSSGHDNVVTYRLDKMEKEAVEKTDCEPHPEYELFNTEEYRKQVFSMFGGESQNVTLLFTANILSDMFERFGDDIRIKRVDDDTYSVDVTVQISKTFFAWIVGTQGKVIRAFWHILSLATLGTTAVNIKRRSTFMRRVQTKAKRSVLLVSDFATKTVT